MGDSNKFRRQRDKLLKLVREAHQLIYSYAPAPCMWLADAKEFMQESVFIDEAPGVTKQMVEAIDSKPQVPCGARLPLAGVDCVYPKPCPFHPEEALNAAVHEVVIRELKSLYQFIHDHAETMSQLSNRIDERIGYYQHLQQDDGA